MLNIIPYWYQIGYYISMMLPFFFYAKNMTVALSVSVNWGELMKFC